MLVQDALQTYLRHLRESGRTNNTVRGYETDLRVLAQRAANDGGQLGEATVAAYMTLMTGLAAATQARRLSALRGLLRSCGRTDLLPDVQAPAITERPAAPSTASRADIESVLGKIPRHADRDHLFFGLLARLGLRPGEALALRVEDLDEASESLTVTGWGGIRRRVFIDDRQILLRLINYIRAGALSSGALFTAAGRDTPLRYQSIQQRWATYCAAAHVSVQLTDLRRAHAEDLLAGGVPEHIVRDRLGQHTGPLTGRGTTASVEAGDEALRAWRNRAPSQPRSTDVETERQGRAG